MELAQILRSLNRNRRLVAGAAVLALVAAVLVAARGETITGGTASAEILVDARESTLGDLRNDTLPLVARSNILARFLGAGGATGAIARKAGLEPDEVTVVGPPLNIDGVPDQATAEQATKRAENASYLVQVQQGDDLPLLTILSKAPTVEQARKLTDGTAATLTDFVTRYQDQSAIPGKRRVTIRRLGATRAAGFENSPSPLVPLVAFAFVFGLSCVGILAWPTARAAMRAAPPDEETAAATNGKVPEDGDRSAEPRPIKPAKPARQGRKQTRKAMRAAPGGAVRNPMAEAKLELESITPERHASKARRSHDR